MKEKLVKAYMEAAHTFAKCSHGVRLKVGAVIVNDDNLVFGYNGTPSGWDNVCEEREYMDPEAGGWLSPEEIEERWPYKDEDAGRYYRLKSKPEVLHAESNAIAKLAKSPINGKGASLFCTHSPCIDCAKLIHQAGITEVYYQTQYRSCDGIEFLQKANIKVTKIGD